MVVHSVSAVSGTQWASDAERQLGSSSSKVLTFDHYMPRGLPPEGLEIHQAQGCLWLKRQKQGINEAESGYRGRRGSSKALTFWPKVQFLLKYLRLPWATTICLNGNRCLELSTIFHKRSGVKLLSMCPPASQMLGHPDSTNILKIMPGLKLWSAL